MLNIHFEIYQKYFDKIPATYNLYFYITLFGYGFGITSQEVFNEWYKQKHVVFGGFLFNIIKPYGCR